MSVKKSKKDGESVDPDSTPKYCQKRFQAVTCGEYSWEKIRNKEELRHSKPLDFLVAQTRQLPGEDLVISKM